MRLKTHKLVLLLLVATVAIVGIQGQNMPVSKSLEPIVDTLEKFMAIIRRALGSQVEGDDDEDKSRERGRHQPGDVVAVERHGDRCWVYDERSRGPVTMPQGLKVHLDEMDSKMLVMSVGVVNLLRESGQRIL
jgi:hypothetical protein